MKATTMKVIALLLTFAAILSAASCTLPGTGEEETTTEAPVINATAMPAATQDIISYVNRLLQQAKAAKPALKFTSQYDAKAFECDNETFKKALPTLSDKMLDGKKITEEFEYGKGFDEFMPLRGTANAFALSAADVISAVCIDPPEGTDTVRRIHIALKSETDPLPEGSFYGTLFSIPAREKIKAEFDKSLDYLTYDGYKAVYQEGFVNVQLDDAGNEITNKDSGNKEYDAGGCRIYLEINRETDEITKLQITADANISAQTTGVGTLASLGSATIDFVLNCTDTYEFDWAEPETAVAED